MFIEVNLYEKQPFGLFNMSPFPGLVKILVKCPLAPLSEVLLSKQP